MISTRSCLAVLGAVFLPLCGGCRAPATNMTPSQTWADSTLQDLNLEEKVGQMIMIGMAAPGNISDPHERDQVRRRIAETRAGGVVLFAEHPLSHSVWIEWVQQQSKIPLFIALDAEWGAGLRLWDLTRFPNAMSIGATQQASNAFESGLRTAQQAAMVGVNILFAPIADVNTNPANPVIGTRAWSDHPDSVALYAGQFVKGVRTGGLMSVAKHFPGHGSTSRDSHTNLPVVRRDTRSFLTVDVHPFKQMMKDSLDALMTAHIIPRGHAFEDSVAATFSHRIVTDLARDSLEFDGLIFTDALNMAGALNPNFDEDAGLMAIRAGVDVLLMPLDARKTQLAIIDAVRAGTLSESRIDSSVARILRAKFRSGLHLRKRFSDFPGILEALNSNVENQRAMFMARDAVTVLKAEAPLPLSRAGESILLITVDFRSYGGARTNPAFSLLEFLDERNGGKVTHISVNPRTWTMSMSSLFREASKSHTVLFADFTGITPIFGWSRNRMITDFASATDRMFYLNFDSPYAVTDLPDDVPVILLGYDSSPAMLEAMSDVIFGMTVSKGRLPIHLSEQYPRGYGLGLPQFVTSVARAADVGLDERILAEIDELLASAIADSAFPAASIAIGREQSIVKRSLYGSHTFDRKRDLESDDVFDLASLTKVIATTTAIMQLYEGGLIDLKRPVADYLPEFGQNGKGSVTIWNLLTHTGGLIPFRPFHMQGVRSAAEVRRRILADTLNYEPGSESKYSDFGPISLVWMIEKITGVPFGEYARVHIFEPLSMMSTGFLPVRQGGSPNAVPTEIDDYFRNRTLQGEVHDETAYLLGGMAGHAGLFSTADDLARFAGMLTADGQIGDRVFLRPETIRLFTTRVDEEMRNTRALGWDTRSPTGYSSAGRLFGPRSFGHTGFTGTSFWIDPDSKLFVILLTNRVHPSRDNQKHIPIRGAVADNAFIAFRNGINTDAATPE